MRRLNWANSQTALTQTGVVSLLLFSASSVFLHFATFYQVFPTVHYKHTRFSLQEQGPSDSRVCDPGTDRTGMFSQISLLSVLMVVENTPTHFFKTFSVFQTCITSHLADARSGYGVDMVRLSVELVAQVRVQYLLLCIRQILGRPLSASSSKS